MDVYAQIVESIIRHQEAIIGPVAVEQAQQVPDIQLDWSKHEVTIKGDPVKAVDKLVTAYKNLFGQISVEVSKEAASPLLGQVQAGHMPHMLQ
jgi:hypothetical protein